MRRRSRRPQRRLGKHFTISEMRAASSAALTAADEEALRELVARFLDPMRERFGPCTVHSAKRSPERNRQVGGASRSYHRYDLRPGDAAADVSFQRGSPEAWALALEAMGAGWVGRYPGHVHVDTR